jgi:NAD-dependent dihydropyrimidine dehydrogenase PreA subunit
MHDVDLYWFSGTGNTLLAARAMRDKFMAAGIKVNLVRIEDTDPGDIDPRHTIGLAVPVACQSTYPLVWDFVRKLPKTNGTKIFLIDTLAKVSGGIVAPMGKNLAAKGYKPIGAKEIIMPTNFLCKNVDEVKNQACVEIGLEAARQFAHDLTANRSVWKQSSFIQWVIYCTSVGKMTWWFMRKLMKMHADPDTCTKCGLCEKLCPVGNISVKDAPPLFANKCQACQRCFAFCPTNAIQIGKKNLAQYQAVAIDDILGEE